MTRLPTSIPGNSIPATVALGELAIAAGMAGYSVALCYADYPAPLVCEMWRRHCQLLSSEQVYHIRTAADVPGHHAADQTRPKGHGKTIGDTINGNSI